MDSKTALLGFDSTVNVESNPETDNQAIIASLFYNCVTPPAYATPEANLNPSLQHQHTQYLLPTTKPNGGIKQPSSSRNLKPRVVSGYAPHTGQSATANRPKSANSDDEEIDVVSISRPLSPITNNGSSIQLNLFHSPPWSQQGFLSSLADSNHLYSEFDDPMSSDITRNMSFDDTYSGVSSRASLPSSFDPFDLTSLSTSSDKWLAVTPQNSPGVRELQSSKVPPPQSSSLITSVVGLINGSAEPAPVTTPQQNPVNRVTSRQLQITDDSSSSLINSGSGRERNNNIQLNETSPDLQRTPPIPCMRCGHDKVETAEKAVQVGESNTEMVDNAVQVEERNIEMVDSAVQVVESDIIASTPRPKKERKPRVKRRTRVTPTPEQEIYMKQSKFDRDQKNLPPTRQRKLIYPNTAGMG